MTLHSVKRFSTFALGLKGTTLAEQWDSHVAKVGGKVFALIGSDGASICFKVSELSFEGLSALTGVAQAPYFAKRKWVVVSKGAALSETELNGYITASYQMIVDGLTRKARAELGLVSAKDSPRRP